MQMVRRILEDLSHTEVIPFGAKIHPEASVRLTSVLEDIGTGGAHADPKVLEHLVDPIVPGLVSQEAFGGERNGAEDGLSTRSRSLHT
jgi:hypothetical protein